MRKIVGAIIFLIAASRTAGSQTLLEMASEHDSAAGPLLITVSGSTPTVTLPQLVAGVDMVIQGHIISAKAELNDEQKAIWSTYRIQPLRELLNKTEGPVASTSSGGTFEVRTLGGELQIAGRTERMRHSHLAPYEAGQQVVLFLKKAPKPDAYEIVAPPYGSLDIQDGRVVIGDPVRASTLDGFRGADLDTVATRIQQIATPTPR